MRPVIAFRVAAKVASGLAGLLLFVLALELLKTAARDLGGVVTGVLSVDAPISALGFGWVSAYVVLSGSPVAAIALTFFAADVIDAFSTFMMIAGSRFGASFIVLLLGFIYTLRGKGRGQSLEMGVLSLLTTYAVYALAIPLGAALLRMDTFGGVRPALPPGFFDLIDIAYGPVVRVAHGLLPAWALFAVGVLVILGAFQLFDRALPDLSKGSPARNLGGHIFRPSVMFAIGCVVTLLTLSVSVSLGILVPLSTKGIARRENVIPYIMGANITTFVDTLFATLLINKPEAFTIVLVEMLSVAAVSLVLLIFMFDRFERILLLTARRILATRATLTLFVIVILLFPLLLLAL